MKVATLAGLVLLVLGIVGFVAGGFSFGRKETLLQVGDMKVSARTREQVPLSPILSGIAVVGGIALIAAGARGGRA